MDGIILAKQFDIKALSLGNLRTLDNGGKMVYLNYRGQPLSVQTPELKAPFGISNWEGTKYTLDVSLAGHDGSKPGVSKFFQLLSSLDEFMIEQGMANSMSWFKKRLTSPDVVDALYTRNVKFPKDRTTGEITDKYPPTFKMSLPYRDGRFVCEAYDGSQERLDLSTLDLKGAKVAAIIQCLGVWVAGGKFGCSWKVVQLRVVLPASINGYAFRQIEDAEAADPSDLDEPSPRHRAKEAVTSVETDEEDGEAGDEENDDEQEAAADDAGEAAAVDDEDDPVETIGAAPSQPPAAAGRKKKTTAKA